MFNNLWNEKYRPTSLDEMVLSEENRKYFTSIQDEISNLLFIGAPGIGKTTIAKIIVQNILKCQYLYINASDENGIGTIRTKVIGFSQTKSIDGKLKVVILDEADYLTPQAQATLRNTIETFSANCRFIFTCNYLDRIILPLQSRCVSFNILPADKKAVGKHIMEICDKENISYTKDELANIILTYYPDIRKILNTIQGSISNNKLTLDTKSLINTDFENNPERAT
jgi:DNA polymerase III delta prime subunit